MRIHELAKELEVTSRELLDTLEQMGVTGKSASSSVPEDLVPRLRASGGKATKAAKPRQVMEPPPKPRAKPKPKKAEEVAAAEPASVDGGAAAVAESVAPVPAAPVAPAPGPTPPPTGPVLQVVRGSTPQILAEKTDRSPAEIVKILFMAGEMVTATTW